ncbi:MAG: glycosyltransferase [Chitinophagales bacterium]
MPLSAGDHFQKIAVVIPTYNEEVHIEKAIMSILDSEIVDHELLTIYVGNDGSDDNTRSILTNLSQKNDKIIVSDYDRIGKPNIINEIVATYNLNKEDTAIVLMDANILIEKRTIFNLCQNIQVKGIGASGAAVFPLSETDNAESTYILRENQIKENESLAFGVVIGLFGACFAIRGECFREIPENFITDDLFITLSVLSQKQKISYSQNTKAFESITMDIPNEFKRKRRFSAGNFQVLKYFITLLNPFRIGFGFVYCFFFHKIIRWIAPILMFLLWIYSIFETHSLLFELIRYGGIFILLFLLSNYILISRQKPAIGQRAFYFLAMNIAILMGFWDFLNGIKRNSWERSKRYETK